MTECEVLVIKSMKELGISASNFKDLAAASKKLGFDLKKMPFPKAALLHYRSDPRAADELITDFQKNFPAEMPDVYMIMTPGGPVVTDGYENPFYMLPENEFIFETEAETVKGPAPWLN